MPMNHLKFDGEWKNISTIGKGVNEQYFHKKVSRFFMKKIMVFITKPESIYETRNRFILVTEWYRESQ